MIPALQYLMLGVMVLSIYMIVRVNCIGWFMQRLLRRISHQADRDIHRHYEWHWRYDAFDADAMWRVMLLHFWVWPLDHCLNDAQRDATHPIEELPHRQNKDALWQRLEGGI